MPEPDAVLEDLNRRLAEFETSIVKNVAPADLSRQAEELAALVGEHLPQRLRYLIARATVDNRLGLVDKAHATLMEARRQSGEQDGAPFRSTISRMLATLHAWRGRGGAATGELLRAVAEATAAGSGADFTAALAQAGRASQETHRFDLALIFFDVALASADLAPEERARTEVNRMECLNRLGKHEECLKEVERTAAICASWNDRRRLLRALEQARALAAGGAFEDAGAVLEEARALLPAEADAFEHVEWRQAWLDVRARDDPASGIRELRTALSRAADDKLHLREAEIRLTLCDALRRTGDGTGALDEAAKALRIATAAHNTHIAERARSAILRSGQLHDMADGAPAQLSERYMLAEALGRGGYGVVRRAIDLETGSDRAVKLIQLDAVADTAERRHLLDAARAEIEAASRLRHPGIVRIHSAFVSDGAIVIVQDLVRGRPLAELRDAGLSEAQVFDIFGRLAHALVAMHDEGIVHRDLKPSNVMIDEMERPVVIDLGLAVLAGEFDADAEKDVRGALGYIAPELLRHGPTPPPHPRQDIYAFGRMLEEFVPPARGPGMWGLLGLRRADPLRTLTRAMTARDPAARPSSLRAVAVELDLRLVR